MFSCVNEAWHNACNGSVAVLCLGQTNKQNMNFQTEIFWGLCIDKSYLFPADHGAKEPVEDTDPSTLSITMVCVSALTKLKSL